MSSNIDSLIISGEGSLEILKNGTIVGASSIEQQGNILNINVTKHNSNSSINCNIIRSSSVSICGNGITINNNLLTLNGKTYQLPFYTSTGSLRNSPSKYTNLNINNNNVYLDNKLWNPPETKLKNIITNIKILHNCQVIIHENFLNKKTNDLINGIWPKIEEIENSPHKTELYSILKCVLHGIVRVYKHIKHQTIIKLEINDDKSNDGWHSMMLKYVLLPQRAEIFWMNPFFKNEIKDEEKKIEFENELEKFYNDNPLTCALFLELNGVNINIKYKNNEINFTLNLL